MSANPEVIIQLGQDWTLKVARIVPEAICYGIYLVLMGFLLGIIFRRGLKTRVADIFLSVVAILMFLGGTLFLCLDVSDLVRRMQIVLLDHPDQGDLQVKLDRADVELKRLVWTGEMLFIFMLPLGDSVVLWRTWTICYGHRRWVAIPMSTWLGSVVAALYELGCDVHTHWAINSLSPSAASVGAKSCAHADLSSYTLSYVTNIICTSLIAYQAWDFRKVMSRYLGAARKTTQVEKILVLLMESGFVYIVLYTLQAVPIYGANLTPAGLTAFNVINAIIQQAMGMYPTIIIILVRMHKSLWDTDEISRSVHSGLQFATHETGGASDTAFSNPATSGTGVVNDSTGSGLPTNLGRKPIQ